MYVFCRQIEHWNLRKSELPIELPKLPIELPTETRSLEQ